MSYFLGAPFQFLVKYLVISEFVTRATNAKSLAKLWRNMTSDYRYGQPQRKEAAWILARTGDPTDRMISAVRL